MQFNQVQLRNTIGISVETFRHWKRVFPPFSGRKKYTLGDLLAAGVLHHLTDRCGVRAGHLPQISKAIVEICNANAWTSLQGKTLVITVEKKTCLLVKDTLAFPSQDTVIVFPLEGTQARIQGKLTSEAPAVVQRHLSFPPVAVGDAHTQRRRA